VRLDGVGFLHWCDHLQDEVVRHLTEGPGAKDHLLLRDGSLELAARLRSTDRTDIVEWAGPLHEQCFSPPAFSANECCKWPAVNRLALRLPQAIRHAVLATGISARADQIVLGGVGAMWPFVMDISQEFGPVWQSAAPEQDTAIGAAWWPVLHERCFSSDVMPPTEAFSLPVATAAIDALSTMPQPEAPEEERRRKDLPPWERDRVF